MKLARDFLPGFLPVPSVADVGRQRDDDGYTVYELTTDQFEQLVRDATNE